MSDNNSSNDSLKDYGQIILDNNEENCRIRLISIIGEIEGHDNMQSSAKTTTYTAAACKRGRR